MFYKFSTVLVFHDRLTRVSGR